MRNRQKESDRSISNNSNDGNSRSKATGSRYVTSLPTDFMFLGRVVGLLRGLTAELDCSCPILHIFALHARVGLLKHKQQEYLANARARKQNPTTPSVHENKEPVQTNDKLVPTSTSISESSPVSPTPTTDNTLTIDQEFDVAVKNSKKLPGTLTNEVKLQIYALYKMSTVGVITDKVAVPGMFDVVGKAKYDAWKKLSNNSDMGNHSKQAYISYINKQLKEYDLS